MNINVVINNTEHIVEVTQIENNKYRCFVDKKEIIGDLSLIKNNNNVSVYSLLVDGKSYDIIFYREKDSATVCVNGYNYSVKIKSPLNHVKNKEKKLHEDREIFQISATIPGKIVAVKVENGAIVKKGQPLIVIEAMKMENELKSPADGKVTNVYVKAGDKVENNALLVEINTRVLS